MATSTSLSTSRRKSASATQFPLAVMPTVLYFYPPFDYDSNVAHLNLKNNGQDAILYKVRLQQSNRIVVRVRNKRGKIYADDQVTLRFQIDPILDPETRLRASDGEESFFVMLCALPTHLANSTEWWEQKECACEQVPAILMMTMEDRARNGYGENDSAVSIFYRKMTARSKKKYEAEVKRVKESQEERYRMYRGEEDGGWSNLALMGKRKRQQEIIRRKIAEERPRAGRDVIPQVEVEVEPKPEEEEEEEEEKTPWRSLASLSVKKDSDKKVDEDRDDLDLGAEAVEEGEDSSDW